MKKIIIYLLSIFFLGVNVVWAEVVEYSDCVDGDTIKIILDKKEYTVRMLAVDTPESVHPTKGVEYYGKEASEYTCQMVKNAKKLELEYDDDSDKEDKYGRLLAWVWVDGKILQEELVKNGYAKVAYLYGDYKYTERLNNVQELASANGIGIWNTEAEAEYNKTNNIEDNEEDTTNSEEDTYSKWDILIIGVLLLVILFVGDKSIKKKAKKKLKSYLK